MKHLVSLLAVLLPVAAAYGQAGSTQELSGIAVSGVPGIRIISSSYDPAAHGGKVTFINDSTLNITAFRGQLKEIHFDGSTETDTLGAELIFADADYRVKIKTMPWVPERSVHPIHPGESYTEEFTTSWRPGERDVQAVSVSYELVVYANNTAETKNALSLQDVVNTRLREAEHERKLAKIGNDLLADAQIDHPVSELARRLQDNQFAKAHILEVTDPAGIGEGQLATKDERFQVAQFTARHQAKAKILEESAKLKAVAQ